MKKFGRCVNICRTFSYINSCIVIQSEEVKCYFEESFQNEVEKLKNYTNITNKQRIKWIKIVYIVQMMKKYAKFTP